MRNLMFPPWRWRQQGAPKRWHLPQHYTVPQPRENQDSNGIPVHGELGRMLKEEAVAYFKIISQHLPSRTEESHDKKLT
jgi:hypothetical protein